MMRVSRSDLHLAADWLDAYDEGREESPAMARVAAYLRREAETRYVREAAREHGKPMAEMRALIDEMMRR
jgi:hypothetical protein